MKNKYTGFVSLLLIVAAIVISGLYALSDMWRTKDLKKSKLGGPLPVIIVPNNTSLKQMDFYAHKLKDFIAPIQGVKSKVNLGLFGYEKQSPQMTVNRYSERDVEPIVRIEYKLSFAFISKRKRFCILDGVLYQEGSQLHDGGEILKIESKRVLVQKINTTKWVPLTERKTTIDRQPNKKHDTKKQTS